MIKILRGFSKSRFLFGQKKKGTCKICWLSLFPLSLLVQKNQPKIDLKLSIIFYRYSRKSFNCRLPKRFFRAKANKLEKMLKQVVVQISLARIRCRLRNRRQNIPSVPVLQVILFVDIADTWQVPRRGLVGCQRFLE